LRRLLIRPGAIGDVILSLPTLEAAQTDYTEVWVARAASSLIRFADRVRAIADTSLDLVGVLDDERVEPALRLLSEFDSIYSWYGSARQEFRDAVRELPFRFFPALPPPNDGVPRIPVPPSARENFVVIHPFASSPAKRWPLERFREVAGSIAAPVRWCAGPEEPLEGAVRFGDLYELACWLSKARLFLGNDSGIAHLAAAVGTPVVAIFLTTDSRVWAPRGPHVTALERPSVADVRRVIGPVP